MRQLLLLALLAATVITPGCRQKQTYGPINVELPVGTKKPKDRKDLMITLTAENKIYAWERELETIHLDSLLKIEIDKLRKNDLDTIIVVINADSASSYGMVFNIMRSARKHRAKVVARVNGKGITAPGYK